MPWIGDIDGNKKFDIIYSGVKYESAAYDLEKPTGIFIRRQATDIPIRKSSRCCGFMGTNYTSEF